MSFELAHASMRPEQRLEHVGLLPAREVVNRQNIEDIAAARINNHAQPEFIPIAGESQYNALTALFEQVSAAGQLTHIEFDGDQEEVHEATLTRLLNAYGQDQPEWSKARAFQELCEELTYIELFRKIVSGELPEDTIATIDSNYPDDVPSAQEAFDNGYRPPNKKGMVRSVHFERRPDGSWVRVLEQVSRANSDDTSTRDWYNNHSSSVPISSTGALSEIMLASRDRLPDGVITRIAELDNTYGTKRLYGEAGAEMHKGARSPYERLRVESAEREQQLDIYIKELAEADNRLQTMQNNGHISYAARLREFNRLSEDIKKRLRLLAPEYSRDILGNDEAAEADRLAAIAFSRGDYMAAQIHMQKAERLKDPHASASCGGNGSEGGDDLFDSPGDSVLDTIEKASNDKEKWTWKRGICQIKSCPTRPRTTDVGPCSICKGCQSRFDAGDDPTKDDLPTLAEEAEQDGAVESMISSFEEMLKAVGNIVVAQAHDDTKQPQLV